MSHFKKILLILIQMLWSYLYFFTASILSSYIGSIHQVFSGVKCKCKFNVLKLVFKLKLVLKLKLMLEIVLKLVLMFILKLVFKHFVWSKTR